MSKQETLAELQKTAGAIQARFEDLVRFGVPPEEAETRVSGEGVTGLTKLALEQGATGPEIIGAIHDGTVWAQGPRR